MLRCVQGPLPQRSQTGLPGHLVQKGYFLPCLCVPTDSMEVAPVEPDDFVTDCVVESSELTPQGWLVRVEPVTLYPARPGQFTCLRLAGGSPAEPNEDWISPWRVTNLQEEDFYLHLLLELPAGASAPPSVACLLPGVTVQLRAPRQDARRAIESSPMGTAPPDAQLWAELDQGKRVRQILDDFYSRVFADAVLAPYFRGVTRERVAGKQYAFLHDEMTGGHEYFGDNMRNTHHWMVISDAVFDHRQRLMETVLREHGLTDSQVTRWMLYEERFRQDIVKDAPRERMLGTQLLPLDGYQEEVLSCGAQCDHCGAIVESGETVLYHRRLGTISCSRCRPSDTNT